MQFLNQQTPRPGFAQSDFTIRTEDGCRGSGSTINRCATFEFPDSTFFCNDPGLQLKPITGNNLTFEAYIIDAGEQINRSILGFFLGTFEPQNPRCLGHSLNDQHTWENRCLWKVTVEYFFVNRDVFVGDD